MVKSEAGGAGHLGRIPELDGIRAISILLVIAAHGLPLGPKVLQLNYAAGLMGMSLFFCLSGFLITSMLMRGQQALDFLARRIIRILPSVALFLSILLALGMPLRNVLLSLTFVSNYFPEWLSGDWPIGHLWSLCVEMQFYIVIGFLTFLLGRRAVWLIPPATVVITLLRVQAGATVDIATHLRVDEILIGGCLALAFPAIARNARLRALLRRYGPLLICGVAALWVAASHPAGGWLGYLRPYFAGLLVGLIVFAEWQPLRAVLLRPVMGYIATISYALYVYHPLMMAGFMNEGSVAVRYLVKRPISFAATLAAAHLSTFYWERRWTDALAARRRRGAALTPGPAGH